MANALTVREFVADTLTRFGYQVSATGLDAKFIDAAVDDSAPYSSQTSTAAKRLIWKFIPELLVLPEIAEDSLSIKRNPDGIRQYYALLSRELGEVNKLAGASVRDRSNCW